MTENHSAGRGVAARLATAVGGVALAAVCVGTVVAQYEHPVDLLDSTVMPVLLLGTLVGATVAALVAVRADGTGRGMMGAVIAASGVSAVAAFLALYRLRHDPRLGLATAFQTAAFLQLVPFAVTTALAVALRRRPDVSRCSLGAVVGCGLFGGCWLFGLEELRHWENEPVTRNALGNIAPDLEGGLGATVALAWPFVESLIVGAANLIGWAVSKPAGRDGPARTNMP